MKKFSLTFLLLWVSPLVSAQEFPFQIGHTNDILTVKFSPDDRQLISYSAGDGRLCLWEVKSGRLLWMTKTEFVQKANEYYTLTSFAFSPDQRLIASGSGNGTIQLWEAKTGKFLWRTEAHKDSVTRVEFSPDGESIVSAASPKDGEDEIKIWRVEDGQLIKKLEGKPCTVIAMKFAENGNLLRTGTLDGNVLEWNLETGKPTKAASTPPCRVRRTYDWETSFTPDLKIAAIRTGEKELTLTDTQTNKIRRKIEVEGNRIYSRFSADGKKLIVTGYGGFTVYDLTTGETHKIEELSRTGSTIELNQDGSLFAEGESWGDAAIKITETKTGKSRFLDGHPSVIATITYSPDGNHLAVAGSDKNIYIFDTAKRTLSKTLVGHTEPITSIAFSPDGKILLAIDENESFKVWDWQSSNLLHDINSNRRVGGKKKIEFSKDGKHFLTVGDGSLTIWSAPLRQPLQRIKTAEKYQETFGDMGVGYSYVPVLTARFAEGGKRVWATHKDGTLRVWDTASGKQLRRFKIGGQAPFLQLSLDAKTIIVAVGNSDKFQIKLFDAVSGKVITGFEDNETDYLEALALSPNGKYFATSNISGKVLLLDVHKQKPIRKLDIGSSSDDAIAFSPDGKTLAVGGRNQNLFLFDVETGSKLWHLIPSYQPSELEIRLTKEKEQRQAVLREAQAQRDAQAAIDTEVFKNQVYISFAHYGDMTNPGELRMMESDEPNKSRVKKSAADSNAIWLRLHNDSPLPIQIPTQSMYLPNPKCFYEFANSRKMSGLCNDREISIWLGLEDKNGKPLRYGFDFGSSAILLPKTSVRFAVPRTILKNGNAIHFRFTFQKEADENKIENYGTPKILRFRETLLPKATTNKE